MIPNKYNENSSLNSNDVDTKNTDIFEQIRKKSEEFTSSETSNKILNNLSNPTNLTNPKIIMDSKLFEEKLETRNQNRIAQILKRIKIKNRLISNTGNSSNYLNKSKSEISLIVNQSSNLIKNDISKILNNSNIIYSFKNNPKNKIILKKINKNSLNKKAQKINNIKINTSKNNKNIKNNAFQDNILLPRISLNSGKERVDDDIWEKLKNSKNISPNDKNKKINEVKFFKRINFLDDIYHIKLLQYSEKINNERFQKILCHKESQNKSLGESIKQLEESRNIIEKIYNEKFIPDIYFLNKEIEKEIFININIINQKNRKIKEIKKIQNQINKLKEIKKNTIRWLYLQIQVKEKLIKIPDYYNYIIGEKMTLNEVNKKLKNTININEYNRILDYQGKNIYKEATQFLKEYEILENEGFERLKKNIEFTNNQIQLKNEIEKYNNNIKDKASKENTRYYELTRELQTLKIKNIKLNKKLREIKNKENMSISKNKNYFSNLSNKILFHSKSDYDIKESININYKNRKSLLFNLVFLLYKWISQNKFKEIESASINLNYSLSDEENMLIILEYAELVINLLLEQKKFYYSNEKLKAKYKKILGIVDKENQREKLLLQLKIEEKKELAKREKIKEKMNKKYFKYNRKIDYDYYRKFKKTKNEKKEIKLEDFFYDVYK